MHAGGVQVRSVLRTKLRREVGHSDHGADDVGREHDLARVGDDATSHTTVVDRGVLGDVLAAVADRTERGDVIGVGLADWHHHDGVGVVDEVGLDDVEAMPVG